MAAKQPSIDATIASVDVRLGKIEKLLFNRFTLSNPIPIPRDEPYEEGLQTNKITAPQGLLLLNNPVLYPRFEITLANGANENVVIGLAGSIRITGPSAGFAIGGIVGGVDGRILIVYNVSGQTMTINNLDAGSTVGNKINTLTGGNVVENTALLYYSGPDSQWILIK